jgi:N-terminal domain of reverse transcriptase
MRGTETLEPMGMLDATAPASGLANGREDDIPDWDVVQWRVVEDDVGRLRQRIFTLTQAGDLKKVRNLQKLTLRYLMQAIFVTARGKTCQRLWVLDADLAAAFDRIDHAHLLDQLGTFPAKGLVEARLRAGVIDQGRFAPTEQGTPQGGVIKSRPDERGPARDGGRRRSPLHPDRRQRRDGAAGLPGSDQVRRRPARLLSHAGTGRAGQGAAGRMAVAAGLRFNDRLAVATVVSKSDGAIYHK